MVIKHDDLYARAWKCVYEKSVFDSECNNTVTRTSPEITVLSEGAADETSITPGTIREKSSETFPQADRSCDGTDTDHYKEPDADTSVEQPEPCQPTPAAQHLICIIIQNQTAFTNTDIVHFQEILGTYYGIDVRHAYTFFRAPSSLFETTNKY